jgi:hypothetical protein
MAWLISLPVPHLDEGLDDIPNCTPTLILTAMAWLISLTVTHLDPDRHGLVDILDCLLVLSLNLGERVPVLVPLAQRLVPLPDGL